MVSRIIFVASLAHSGSTVVDLLLGCHPRIISLGEIHKAVDLVHEPGRMCTCGEEASNCKIWGPLKQKLDMGENSQAAQLDYKEKYEALMEIINDVYGNDIMMVDSSKYQEAMQQLSDHFNDKLSILFVLKDVRSFISSMVKREKKEPHLSKIYFASIPYNLVRWYHRNKRRMKEISTTKVPHFQFGYEELCFQPVRILKKICEFLGIEYSRKMLEPVNSERHIIAGNPMRYDENKMQGIFYDCRWLQNRKYFLYGWLFLPFLKWNEKQVYGNLKD